jgi:DNA-binding response OmpR family regulator
LLLSRNKPITKNEILKTVWKYADDADTHTVETHVYRLRKKIKDKFLDEKFIINNNDGYFI